MAAQRKRKKKTGGPYLASAVFCDSIVEGADKTLSAIRIVDRVTLTIPADAPADAPSEEIRLPLIIRALISFRTGYSRGRHELHIVMNSPTGKKQIGPKQRLALGKEPNSGINLNIGFTMLVNRGGLFWFDVVLNGKIVTRMPLDVVVVRAPQESKADRSAKPPPVARRASAGRRT